MTSSPTVSWPSSVDVDLPVNVTDAVVLDGHRYDIGSGHTHLTSTKNGA